MNLMCVDTMCTKLISYARCILFQHMLYTRNPVLYLYYNDQYFVHELLLCCLHEKYGKVMCAPRKQYSVTKKYIYPYIYIFTTSAAFCKKTFCISDNSVHKKKVMQLIDLPFISLIQKIAGMYSKHLAPQYPYLVCRALGLWDICLDLS